MEHDRYDPVNRYPPNRPLNMIPGSSSFPLLELILDPTRTPPPLLQDAILVSIDLELRFIKAIGKDQITQIGVASLDTRLLARVDTEDSQSLVESVKSRIFSIHRKRASDRRWKSKCFWALPERIGHEEIPDKLDEVLFNTKFQQEPRNMILIGHSIRSDRNHLRKYAGYDVKYVPSVRAILDTGRMMCNAYDFGITTHSHFSLRWILRLLNIRFDQLHDAGNDAMFTMKALLLMFSNWRFLKGKYLWNIAEDPMLDAPRSSQSISTNTDDILLWECQLEVLTAIARESWLVPKKPVKIRFQNMKPDTDLLVTDDGFDLLHIVG